MADNLATAPKAAAIDKLSPADVLPDMQSWAFLPNQPAECLQPAEHYLVNWQERDDAGNWLNELITEPYGEGRWVAGINKLNWDTEFFGLNMGRLMPLINPAGAEESGSELQEAGQRLLTRVLSRVTQMGIEHLSVLVHPQDTVTQACLQKSGFMLRDTTVRYRLKLSEHRASGTDARIRKASAEDLEALQEIAAETFGSRRYNINRFNSDPSFSASKVAQLYKSWIGNSLSGHLADAVFVCEDKGKVLGFITLKLPSAIDLRYGINLAHIPLNAVRPDAQGQGIYSQLVDYALEWCRHQGVDYVEIWTQLANQGVHHCWSRRGARIAWSCHSFHWSAAAP